MHIVLEKMSDLTEATREMIRHNSLGPHIAWGSWSWSFHTGDCWAAIAYNEDCMMMGWAAITKETDRCPVMGVYILKDHRKKGLGRIILTALLNWLTPAILPKDSTIYASTERWPTYFEIAKNCGHRCQLWE
jgi:GNAT superfamily N-acetyltransferase